MQPAPWESGNQPPAQSERAPWEDAAQAPMPPAHMPPTQYAPPTAPYGQQPGGFKLFPTDRRRQILVIAFLVVFFIVGPFLIWLGRGGPKTREKGPDPEAVELQKQLSEAQRAEADEVLRRAVIHLRSLDDGSPATRNRIVQELQDSGGKGQWQTAHYNLTQVTMNTMRVNRKFDVVIICMPKPGAAEQDIAGYARFFWDSADVSIEWN